MDAAEQEYQHEYQQPAEDLEGGVVGPIDRSLLTRFDDHVASHILLGELRDKLKIPAHGQKFKKVGNILHCVPLMQLVDTAGLSTLSSSCMTIVDHELISAFVERWHAETSSFHLPFGEMTITLDDVSCLLHLPVGGVFFDPAVSVTVDDAAELAVRLLGVTQQEAVAEVTASRGALFRFSWVMELIQRQVVRGELVCAARAYLLLLVGMTIFANKHFDRVDAKWLLLFDNLQDARKYAWGAAALAFMYDQLNSGCQWGTRQCGGYATLIMGWIFEHFPHICPRRDSGDAGLARVRRWERKKTDGLKIHDYRQRIDELTLSDVIWRPFEDHREQRPLDPMSIYRGYLHWGDIIVPYLPDRCARQFGYVQRIPAVPLSGRPRVRLIHYAWAMWSQHVTWAADYEYARDPSMCADDYYAWYDRVSVPRLLGPGVASPDHGVAHSPRDVGPSHDAAPSGSQQPPPFGYVQVMHYGLRELLNAPEIVPGGVAHTQIWRLIEETQRQLP